MARADRAVDRTAGHPLREPLRELGEVARDGDVDGQVELPSLVGPLERDGRGWLLDEAVDENDPWQFGNFRVT